MFSRFGNSGKERVDKGSTEEPRGFEQPRLSQQRELGKHQTRSFCAERGRRKKSFKLNLNTWKIGRQGELIHSTYARYLTHFTSLLGPLSLSFPAHMAEGEMKIQEVLWLK